MRKTWPWGNRLPTLNWCYFHPHAWPWIVNVSLEPLNVFIISVFDRSVAFYVLSFAPLFLVIVINQLCTLIVCVSAFIYLWIIYIDLHLVPTVKVRWSLTCFFFKGWELTCYCGIDWGPISQYFSDLFMIMNMHLFIELLLEVQLNGLEFAFLNVLTGWNGKYFLWGLFRRKKRDEVACQDRAFYSYTRPSKDRKESTATTTSHGYDDVICLKIYALRDETNLFIYPHLTPFFFLFFLLTLIFNHTILHKLILQVNRKLFFLFQPHILLKNTIPNIKIWKKGGQTGA